MNVYHITDMKSVELFLFLKYILFYEIPRSEVAAILSTLFHLFEFTFFQIFLLKIRHRGYMIHHQDRIPLYQSINESNYICIAHIHKSQFVSKGFNKV